MRSVCRVRGAAGRPRADPGRPPPAGLVGHAGGVQTRSPLKDAQAGRTRTPTWRSPIWSINWPHWTVARAGRGAATVPPPCRRPARAVIALTTRHVHLERRVAARTKPADPLETRQEWGGVGIALRACPSGIATMPDLAQLAPAPSLYFPPAWRNRDVRPPVTRSEGAGRAGHGHGRTRTPRAAKASLKVRSSEERD